MEPSGGRSRSSTPPPGPRSATATTPPATLSTPPQAGSSELARGQLHDCERCMNPSNRNVNHHPQCKKSRSTPSKRHAITTDRGSRKRSGLTLDLSAQPESATVDSMASGPIVSRLLGPNATAASSTVPPQAPSDGIADGLLTAPGAGTTLLCGQLLASASKPFCDVCMLDPTQVWTTRAQLRPPSQRGRLQRWR